MTTAKPRKLQPASREKTCPICGTVYTYPEKESGATRFHCEPCAALPEHYRRFSPRWASVSKFWNAN